MFHLVSTSGLPRTPARPSCIRQERCVHKMVPSRSRMRCAIVCAEDCPLLLRGRPLDGIHVTLQHTDTFLPGGCVENHRRRSNSILLVSVLLFYPSALRAGRHFQLRSVTCFFKLQEACERFLGSVASFTIGSRRPPGGWSVR